MDMSYEAILRRALEKIPATIDKREGSVVYDALAPACAELAQEAIAAEWRLNQCFSDTAVREYLVKRAKERGIYPRSAAYAILKGEFNQAVPAGSRYNLDELNYVVTECIDETNHIYRVQCETIGSIGNTRLGDMIPIDYLAGLTRAELTELLIPGADEEETEAFRERYHASFNSQAYGGNRADYREKIMAIQGVGGLKIYRGTNETGQEQGGHVRIVILNSEYQKPSEELVEMVQTTIDPAENQGDGDGLAPIGHVVHIQPVTEEMVHVAANITYEDGYCFEDIKSYILAALDEYFLELNKSWSDGKTLIARIAQIESRLLEVDGILDITGTRLNGEEKNYALGSDSIAVRGDVSG